MAMKVPTYKSQAALSGKSGGIQFGVQASPDLFSQSARAQTNLFATMEKAALGFLEAETKAQRASQLTDAQNAWNAQNLTDTADLNKMPSSQIVGTYETRQKANTSKVSSGIKDKVVRKRFDEWASGAKTESTANVNKIYRSKWVDEGKAAYAIRIDQLENEIQNGSPFQQARARTELYGNPATGKIGIFQESVELGYNTPEAAYTDEKKSKSRLISGVVRRELSEANANDDAAAARALYTGLMDATDQRYVGLDPASRQSLADRALTLSEQIDRAAVARDNAQNASDEKKRKKKHATNLAAMVSSISQAQLATDQGSATLSPNEPMPTLAEVLQMYADDQINEKGKNTLITLLSANEAVTDSPIVIRDIHEALANAKTPAEIDTIVEQTFQKVKLNGGVTLDTAQAIANQAQTFKDKTPLAIAIKRYQSALKTSLGESVMKSHTGRIKNPNADMRVAEAIVFFQQRVNDPLSPVPPRTAYLETMNNYKRAQDEDLATTAPSMRIINTHNALLPENSTALLPDNFLDWKATHFAAARAAISSYTARTPENNQGMSALEKTIEYQKLEIIEQSAIEAQRIKAELQARQNNNTGDEGQENDAGFSFVFDVIKNWFGNDDETVSDIRAAN